MNKKIERKLREEFPSLFKNLYGDQGETCMAYGCSIRDGWEELLRDTCTKMVECQERNPQTEIYFSQIKEKFGYLRLGYTWNEPNEPLERKVRQELSLIIAKAESESGNICENCGSKDGVTTEPRPGGIWVVTMCETCRENIESEQPAKDN